VLALAGATVRRDPAQPPIHDAVVLIGEGKILAVGARAHTPIPAGINTVDCTSTFITAGFWNSHVHFHERKWADAATIPARELAEQLKAFTRFGFTNVFDLSSPWENTQHLRARIESAEVLGPRIRTTGEGLVPPNALPSDDVCRVMGVMPTALPEVTSATQAADAATRLLEQGADGIKLFASSPHGGPLVAGAIDAAARAAHRRDRPVFVHPNTVEDVLVALDADADVVAHTTPRSGPWNQRVIAAMKRHRCALTPTLKLWHDFLRHDRVSLQRQIVEAAFGQLRAWADAGGRVLFGTDLGAVDPDPTREYLLMERAGLSAGAVLASLTTAPANQFGCERDFGRVDAGFAADLVVLRADPFEHIANFAEVAYTLRAGTIVYGGEPFSTFG
jgi:imidazolonepropionase-like amidohydrolase